MYTAPPIWALAPSRSGAPGLWRGCAFAVCYAWGLRDLVAGRQGQLVGASVPAPAPDVGERGGAYLCQVGNTDQSWMSSAIGYGQPAFSTWQGEFSLAVFVRFDGKQTLNTLIGRRVILDPDYPGLTLTRTPTGRIEVEGGVTSPDGVLNDGDTALVAFTRRGSDARLFCRGVQIASNSSYAGVASPESAGGTFWVGGGYSDSGGAPNYSHNGLVYVAMAWERAIDPAEVQALALDPFTMFRPARRALMPVSAPVTANIDLGAGTLMFSGQTPTPSSGQSLGIAPGALTIQGSALSIQVGTAVPVGIDIGAGSLLFTTAELLAQAGLLIDAIPGALNFSGQPLSLSAGTVEAIGPATLTFAGQALSITDGASLSVDIGAGTMSLSGAELSQVAGVNTAIASGSMMISGQTLEFSDGSAVQIDSARLVVIRGSDRVAVINDFDRVVRIH